MTTKNKRIARQQAAAPPAGGVLLTPPEIVAALIVKRTLGDNEVFDRCSHSLQLLPNGAILLLVTSDGHDKDGAECIYGDTFLLGEEVPGFKALKAMIETSDDPA
jgi:hypothetical protein